MARSCCDGWTARSDEDRHLRRHRLCRAQYRARRCWRAAMTVTLFDRAGLPPPRSERLAGYGDRLTGRCRAMSPIADAVDAVDRRRLSMRSCSALRSPPARNASGAIRAHSRRSICWRRCRSCMAARPPWRAARHQSLVGVGLWRQRVRASTLLDEETPCDPVSLYAITNSPPRDRRAARRTLWQAISSACG